MDEQAGKLQARYVLMGASNLTLSFPRIVNALEQAHTGPIEILSAHGHGRSYGRRTTVIVRSLPPIKDCGLWKYLEELDREETPVYGLVTDIGNDLLYRETVDTTYGWVADAMRRLGDLGIRTAMTFLPWERCSQMSAFKYHTFKQIMYPGKTVPWHEMCRRAPELNARLEQLADDLGIKHMHPPAKWYGFDPVHIRSQCRSEAWATILSLWNHIEFQPEQFRSSTTKAIRYWRLPAQLKEWGGRARIHPQPCYFTPKGSSISVY